MRLIDARSAEEYLRETGRIAPEQHPAVRELAGGVSNLVLRISFPHGDRPDFVLKQARGQLRTLDPWYCSVERIWREVEVLRTCRELLQQCAAGGGPAIDTPEILFEDRENYLFAMTAAPAEHVVWKSELLAGRVQEPIAAACGRLLGSLHAGSWGDARLAARLADRQIFNELRIDPYYRATARAFPQARQPFDRLIQSVEENRLSLVHADFSPKNLLVFPGGLMLVDFETGHYGDPAFDLGFFLSHLVLKAIHRAPDHARYLALSKTFWNEYRAIVSPISGDEAYRRLVARGVQNFAGCAWARVDGTSKVDYLVDPARKEAVRTLCQKILGEPISSWNDAIDLCSKCLAPLI